MNAKMVEDWLRRPYARTVEFVTDDEGGYWTAYLPQFGLHSLKGVGESRAEAEEQLDDVLRVAFQMMAERGDEPPAPLAREEPSTARGSGKVLVRMSPDLHARLKYQAESYEVSVNHYIVELLARGVGREQTLSKPEAERRAGPPTDPPLRDWTAGRSVLTVVKGGAGVLDSPAEERVA